MPARHLLVIEDDPDLAALLQLDLQDAGYRVSHADSIMTGLIQLREDPPDLLLLDLGLPDGDGRQVLIRLRQGPSLPIIVLTARDSVAEKVDVFGLGADDYLVKPFERPELLARIAVQLRDRNSVMLRVGDLEMNVTQSWVRHRGNKVDLSPKEFEILQLLMRSPGRVYPMAEIAAMLWPEVAVVERNLIAVHIGNLRSKFHDIEAYGVIRTVRGVGYALRT